MLIVQVQPAPLQISAALHAMNPSSLSMSAALSWSLHQHPQQSKSAEGMDQLWLSTGVGSSRDALGGAWA